MITDSIIIRSKRSYMCPNSDNDDNKGDGVVDYDVDNDVDNDDDGGDDHDTSSKTEDMNGLVGWRHRLLFA